MGAPRVAPTAILVACLLLAAPLAMPPAQAAGASYYLTAKNAALATTSEFRLGEVIYLELAVRTWSTGENVYPSLRINRIEPSPLFMGTISESGSPVFVSPNTLYVHRFTWDQRPSGESEPVGAGRFQIAYVNTAGQVVAAVVIDIGYKVNLQVTAVDVQSARAPAPAPAAVPHAPQPVLKRLSACVVNAGMESTLEAPVAFYWRASGEDPAARHLIRSTRAFFDGSQPKCPGGSAYPNAYVQFDWVVPTEAVNGSVGADTLLVIADPARVILEDDETDNARTRAFTLYDPCEFPWALCPPPSPPSLPPLPWPLPPTIPPDGYYVYSLLYYIQRLVLP